MKTAWYALIILLMLSAFAVDLHFSSSYEEYSMYNSNWNGTSLFVNDALESGAKLITDYEELSGLKNSTLIIIEPEDSFSADELRKIRDYQNNRNNIIISDESGSSDTLMKLFGSDLSIEEADLMSSDMEYQDPQFIICYSTSEDPIINGVGSVALNRPSVALGGDTLITTSFMSWVDKNGDRKADGTESLGKRAVMVRDGNVYLIADSGIFQNALYKDENLKDNRKLIENILRSSNDIYLESRHSAISSEEETLAIINTFRQNEMIKAAAIIIIIFLILLIYRGKYD